MGTHRAEVAGGGVGPQPGPGRMGCWVNLRPLLPELIFCSSGGFVKMVTLLMGRGDVVLNVVPAWLFPAPRLMAISVAFLSI